MAAQNETPESVVADPQIQAHVKNMTELWVEVSPVLHRDGSCNVTDDIGTANMVSVYICNPLALHVIDFERGFAWPDAQAIAAFQFADALAALLGCDVVSTLERNPLS